MSPRVTDSQGKSEGGITPARTHSIAHPEVDGAPEQVLELAASGVRFVLSSLKLELDFSRDTLPVVDHYLSSCREDLVKRPEAMALTAHALGAYLGEVVRRCHTCWWRIDDADPGAWRLEFRSIFLSFYPVQAVYSALTRDDGESAFAGFELPEDDRDALLARLKQLPEVSEDEYFAPSSRLEVLDIAVDALLAKRATEPAMVRPFTPDDYQENQR